MLNILFFLHNYPGYGGIEMVTTKLANYLVAHGKHICVYSIQNNNKEVLLKDLDKRIVFVEAIDTNPGTPENMSQLLSFMKEQRIELIIFQDSYCPIENLLYAVQEQYNCQLWVVEHNTPNYKQLEFKHVKPKQAYYRIKRWLFYPLYLIKLKKDYKLRAGKLYNIADKYLLLSDQFVPVWEDMTGIVEHPKLGFMNNPITIDAPESCHFDKEKMCLFCGRLSPQKGIDKLMKIWNLVCRTHPDWTLFIIGDGPEKDMVKQYIERKHLKNVRLEGFQKDTWEYYYKSSILCMSSIYEGWPLSLGEAMSYGCVPITFDSYAAAKDIIKSGENGYLITPFEIKEYASKLSELMDNHDLLLEMSRKAFESSRRFDISAIGAKWLEMVGE